MATTPAGLPKSSDQASQQYNDWLAANSTDRGTALSSGAWNPESGTFDQYEQGLQQQYQNTYGVSASQPVDFTQYQAAPADALLGLSQLGGPQTGPGVRSSNDFRDPGQAQYALSEALKYDPNATLVNGTILQFDQSKLPKFQGGSDFSQYDKYGGLAGAGEGGGNQSAGLFNSGAVIHDPNYGDWTVNSNVKPDKNSTFGMLAGMIPLAVGMIASGGAMTPALMAEINGSFGALKGLGSDNPFSAILSGLAGMTGVPGAGTVANFIMQQLQQQKNGGG